MTLINSRADQLEGRVWGKAFRERRCVILVGGFFEWTGPKNARQPHAIHRSDGNAMAFAPLWSDDAEERGCFSIVTVPPSTG